MSDVPVKVDWQWPAACVYSVAFITVSVLVGIGKLHTEAMLSLVAWLAPGPWQARGVPPALPATTTTLTETHVETTTIAAPPAPAKPPISMSSTRKVPVYMGAPAAEPLPPSIPVTIDESDGDG